MSRRMMCWHWTRRLAEFAKDIHSEAQLVQFAFNFAGPDARTKPGRR